MAFQIKVVRPEAAEKCFFFPVLVLKELPLLTVQVSQQLQNRQVNLPLEFQVLQQAAVF